jgi:hypothetical protein
VPIVAAENRVSLRGGRRSEKVIERAQPSNAATIALHQLGPARTRLSQATTWRRSAAMICSADCGYLSAPPVRANRAQTVRGGAGEFRRTPARIPASFFSRARARKEGASVLPVPECVVRTVLEPGRRNQIVRNC